MSLDDDGYILHPFIVSGTFHIEITHCFHVNTGVSKCLGHIFSANFKPFAVEILRIFIEYVL